MLQQLLKPVRPERDELLGFVGEYVERATSISLATSQIATSIYLQ